MALTHILMLIPIFLQGHRAESTVSPQSCTQDLKGVITNGRCFFVPDVKTDWNTAWNVCQTYNATLAQIHTTHEFEAIKPMVSSSPAASLRIWVALQRDHSIVGKPCAVTPNTSHWYDTATTYNDRLMAANTWIRCHSCEDVDNGQQYYLTLFPTDWVFQDEQLGYLVYPLCQATSCAINYNETEGVCMIETPIESYPGTHPQDCGDVCSSRTWCRSFNFLLDPLACGSSQCQLFSWTTREKTVNCTAKVTVQQNCYHYDIEL